jgi:hypothetical protein
MKSLIIISNLMDRCVSRVSFGHLIALVLILASASVYGQDISWGATQLGDLDGEAGTRDLIMNLIMYVGWGFGLVKGIQGIRELDRGEEGKTKLVQAALFTAVPTFANFIW